MGKVTVFCPITGCTPESAKNALSYSELLDDYTDLEDDSPIPPGIQQAITLSLNEDEIQGQEAISVIIPKGAPADDMSWRVTREELVAISDSEIQIVHGCTRGEWWDFGSVSSSSRTQHWLISLGPAFFVQTHSLPILTKATRGRMSITRLWRMVMHDRFLRKERYGLWGYGVVGDVDYGEITSSITQFPAPIPGLDPEGLLKLGKSYLGDADTLRKILLDRGLWVWMRPDRFPIDHSDYHPTLVTSEQDIGSSPEPSLERLPLEVISSIITCIPTLSSVLALGAVSKTLRSRLYSYNSLSRVWMKEQAPWWDNEDVDVGTGWGYIKSCAESPSMRNRKRIWNSVVQIETLADQLGY